MPSYPQPATALLEAKGDGVQAIIDTATLAAAPAELQTGKVYAFRTPSGVQEIDLTGDAYRDAPARKRGTTTVRDSGSFLTYWGKHSDEASEIYADADRLSVTAVLNANGPAAADWGDHRLRLELRETDAWKQWAALDGKLVDQERFAEFLEEHLPELLEPAAAEMLEIAQSFQAATKVDFQSGTRLATGQRQFQYVETTTAKAGQKGQLTIPETFVIGLIPFEGSEGYRLTARLRYRIVDTQLRIGYKLERPGDIRKTAFDDVLKDIAEQIDTPIMNGTAA